MPVSARRDNKTGTWNLNNSPRSCDALRRVRLSLRTFEIETARDGNTRSFTPPALTVDCRLSAMFRGPTRQPGT